MEGAFIALAPIEPDFASAISLNIPLGYFLKYSLNLEASPLSLIWFQNANSTVAESLVVEAFCCAKLGPEFAGAKKINARLNNNKNFAALVIWFTISLS